MWSIARYLINLLAEEEKGELVNVSSTVTERVEDSVITFNWEESSVDRNKEYAWLNSELDGTTREREGGEKMFKV